ncbi:MAG: PQQ-binding-like beta-propeller repeat protein, partial [Dokdonella sp.]
MNAKSRLRATFGLALTAASGTVAAADWLQFGYDAAHSGYNPVETQLTHANVAQLSQRYSVSVLETVDSAPVYLSGVATASGTKNLLFALTRQSGKLLAIDAATGSIVWSKTTGSGAQLTTSAPAIDPGRLYVYSHGMDGNIHKYQVGDGTEITTGGWPQPYTNRPSQENANGSLALATWNGTSYLYSVTSGYFDSGDYQGHLTTVNLATGTQTVFNTICSNVTAHIGPGYLCDIGGSSGKSAVWGRGGATFDAARGRIYITSGNGPYTASTGNGMNWGDSVLALAPDGTGATPGVPYDSYTPTDYQSLDSSDIDLGSMSMALLPVPAGSSIPHVGMQGGKDDKLHVVNLDDMSGGGGPRHVGGEMQLIDAGGEFDGAREQPAVWVDATGATWVFFASFKHGVTAFKMSLGANNVPTLTRVWNVYRGTSVDTTSPVVANGVLYHVSSCPGQDSNCLVARDPATGTALYTSAALGNLHFQSPIVVDGGVYVFDANAKLWAFGGNGTPPVTHVVTPSAGANGTISPSTPQTVNDGATTAFTVTPAAHYVASVSGCGGSLAGNVYTTGPVTADCTVTASFSLQAHTVTPTATNGGTITPATAQTVNDGDVVEFSVVPDIGSSILAVSG